MPDEGESTAIGQAELEFLSRNEEGKGKNSSETAQTAKALLSNLRVLG